MKELAKPVLLIGMMGAGKTTLGRLLAARLGVDFFDLDEEIEKAFGKAVADIFREDGEAAFRELEQKALAGLLKRRPPVIAAGGGVFPDAKAVNVWITGDIEALYRRSKGATPRPKRGTLDAFKALYETRKKGYLKAEIRVENNTPGPAAAVADILKALEAI